MSTRANVVKPKEWQHVFVTYDGSAKDKGLKIYIDGAEVPLKVLQGTRVTDVTVRSIDRLEYFRPSKTY